MRSVGNERFAHLLEIFEFVGNAIGDFTEPLHLFVGCFYMSSYVILSVAELFRRFVNVFHGRNEQFVIGEHKQYYFRNRAEQNEHSQKYLIRKSCRNGHKEKQRTKYRRAEHRKKYYAAKYVIAENFHNCGTSNLYPTPHTVLMRHFLLVPSFWRILFTCTSTVRVSP